MNRHITEGLLAIINRRKGKLTKKEAQIVKTATAALGNCLPKPDKEEWVKAGVVGVDSGQLVVCDPCHIGSQWKSEEAAKERVAPSWKHKDGTILYCGLHGKAPSTGAVEFGRYDEIVPKYGKSMNDMVSKGEATEVKVKRSKSHEFSYTGCCEASDDEKLLGGQLNYLMGRAGAGVVTRTGIGDGCYPVYLRHVDLRDWGRRVAELKVVFLDEEDAV